MPLLFHLSVWTKGNLKNEWKNCASSMLTRPKMHNQTSRDSSTKPVKQQGTIKVKAKHWDYTTVMVFIGDFPYFYVLWHHTLPHCVIAMPKQGLPWKTSWFTQLHNSSCTNVLAVCKNIILWHHRVFLYVSGKDSVYFKEI